MCLLGEVSGVGKQQYTSVVWPLRETLGLASSDMHLWCVHSDRLLCWEVVIYVWGVPVQGDFGVGDLTVMCIWGGGRGASVHTHASGGA